MDSYREEIKKGLSNVSYKGRILFAVLICERLYPNYVAFQKKFNWGDHEALLAGIALIRQYLINEDLFEDDQIISEINRIDEITPHTEDFPGIITSFALDACTSIYSTLNCLIDKNIDHIVDVAMYSRDTVDMFIQEVENIDSNDPKIEEKIAKNQFMILEKKTQRDLLSQLSVINLDRITDKIVEGLANRGVGIKLELLSDH